MNEPRAETRDMVWKLVHLVADGAPPQRIETSTRFALRALAARQAMLTKERRLVEAILKWQCGAEGKLSEFRRT